MSDAPHPMSGTAVDTRLFAADRSAGVLPAGRRTWAEGGGVANHADHQNHVISGGCRPRPLSGSSHHRSFLCPYFTMAAFRAVIPRSAALRSAQPTLRRFNSSFQPNPEAAKAFTEARQHAFEHAASTSLFPAHPRRVDRHVAQDQPVCFDPWWYVIHANV